MDTTGADLGGEKAMTLRLLYSMFDEANELGGTESADSDMEQEAAAGICTNTGSYQSPSSHDPGEFEVVPAAQTVSKMLSVDRQQAATSPLNPQTWILYGHHQVQTKLKDLFALCEEDGK